MAKRTKKSSKREARVGVNVSLTPELMRMVNAKVASGLYGSVSEVVREALRSGATAAGGVSSATPEYGTLETAWEELRQHLKRLREFNEAPARLDSSLEMYENGLDMKRTQLKRDFPNEPDIVIEQRVNEWLFKDSWGEETMANTRSAPERLRRLLNEWTGKTPS